VGNGSQKAGSELIEEELLMLEAFSKLVDLLFSTLRFVLVFFVHLFLQLNDA